jgi:acetoacetyl-CoA synthetase
VTFRRYNGRAHAHLPKLRALLAGLAAKDVARPKVVVVPFAGKDPAAPPEAWDDGWVAWTDFVAQGKTAALGRTPDGEIEWARMDFNWPLWILFSSGTTGWCVSFSQRRRLLICLSQDGPSMNTNLPIAKSLTNFRPIVHRAGGMLIQSLKEHLICADIKPNDVFFYYTTTGWMMFN